MKEGDSEVTQKPIIENSIKFTLAQLNSHEFKVIHDTVLQVSYVAYLS